MSSRVTSTTQRCIIYHHCPNILLLHNPCCYIVRKVPKIVFRTSIVHRDAQFPPLTPIDDLRVFHSHPNAKWHMVLTRYEFIGSFRPKGCHVPKRCCCDEVGQIPITSSLKAEPASLAPTHSCIPIFMYINNHLGFIFLADMGGTWG